MPFKCCVPKCRGNYAGGPKVSTFAFPKDLDIQKKWLKAVSRQDFIPNANSRVCELHFNDTDIERCTKVYSEDTGQLLELPLKCPRLVKDAVPSKLPGCPSYLSKPERPQREAPEEKRARLEYEAVEKSVSESLAIEEARFVADKVTSFADFKIKISQLNLDKWLVSRKENKLNFYFDEDCEIPNIKLCVSVSETLMASVFYDGSKIGDKDIKIESLREFEKLLSEKETIGDKKKHYKS